ncbi:efflux transporter outer membrane subunit [Mangrovimonas sp. ST2L15]|uniref:efflux transporter outer membrane subunit n=1 Tax=Mangrovimonas sp. ST2L15 TaxID=1645916 RepID=UPI0006B506A2|nr:efflux transporter outer membrane subunit [Mangrovimonas sp. ST2L15]
MKLLRAAYLLGVFGWMTTFMSCSVQKSYVSPEVADSYVIGDKTSDSISFADTKWWDIFNDPTLTQLIEEGLENNLSLQNTIIALKQSQLQYNIARADLFPAINYGASYQASTNSITSDITDQALIAANVSYTIDLWGRIKNENLAAFEAYLTTEMAYYQVQATLVTQIATLYFSLRDVDNKIIVAENMVSSMNDYKNIIDARYDGGFISKVDVNQITIEIKDVEIALQTLLRARKQLENAISIALGSEPKSIPRGLLLQEQVFPSELPVGVSSQLLQRRPSIMVLEHRLKSQLATVGATEALQYPNITLSFDLGGQLTNPSMLFSSIIGELVGPIFNSHKIKNAIALQGEVYKQLENEYKQAYLVALQEIEDALIAINTYKMEVDIRNEQLLLSEEALNLSWVRYNEGVSSFLEFLNLQNSLFEAQLNASESYKLQLHSIVKLYLALGGGWSLNQS